MIEEKKTDDVRLPMQIRITMENYGESMTLGRIVLQDEELECFVADALLHDPRGPKWIADTLLAWSSMVLKGEEES
jgi:hypothetical protein